MDGGPEHKSWEAKLTPRRVLVGMMLLPPTFWGFALFVSLFFRWRPGEAPEIAAYFAGITSLIVFVVTGAFIARPEVRRSATVILIVLFALGPLTGLLFGFLARQSVSGSYEFNWIHSWMLVLVMMWRIGFIAMAGLGLTGWICWWRRMPWRGPADR